MSDVPVCCVRQLEQTLVILPFFCLGAVFQKVCIIGYFALGPCRASHNDTIVHPPVLLVTGLNLYMQVKPILAGVYRSTFHQRPKHLRGTCSGALGPVLDQHVFFDANALSQSEVTECKEMPCRHF